MKISSLIFGTILSSTALAESPLQVGKTHQLFLDDWVIEHTVHLTRRVQSARNHEANPLVVAREPWEPSGYAVPSVLSDTEEGIFKAWLDGMGIGVFYFTSGDGIHWERPALHLFPEFDAQPTNHIVLSGSEINAGDAPAEKLAYIAVSRGGVALFWSRQRCNQRHA